MFFGSVKSLIFVVDFLHVFLGFRLDNKILILTKISIYNFITIRTIVYAIFKLRVPFV